MSSQPPVTLLISQCITDKACNGTAFSYGSQVGARINSAGLLQYFNVIFFIHVCKASWLSTTTLDLQLYHVVVTSSCSSDWAHDSIPIVRDLVILRVFPPKSCLCIAAYSLLPHLSE